jgi:peroxiredoxin
MNKLKSMFIGMFPMLAMGISGYAIYQMVQFGFNLIWLGAVLTTMPIMMFIARVMMFKGMARTTSHFPLLTSLAVVGLAVAIYGFIELHLSEFYYPAIASAAVGFVTFMIYNFWYSSLGRKINSKIGRGKTLPAFHATDAMGKSFSSDALKGKPAVLMFYRGNWCPLCMAQIKEVAARYKELSDKGVTVALISPQPEKNTQSLAKKFDVPFLFLTDKNNKAARALGIEMKNGLPMGMEMFGYDKDTVLPTVIVTDAEGRIIYLDETNNYRIRPEPSEYLNILNNHLKTA